MGLGGVRLQRCLIAEEYHKAVRGMTGEPPRPYFSALLRQLPLQGCQGRLAEPPRDRNALVHHTLEVLERIGLPRACFCEEACLLS